MAGDCNRTSIQTSKNGGSMVYKIGAKINALQTMDEQFCLARSYAIDDGASLAATAQSFTQARSTNSAWPSRPACGSTSAASSARSPRR